MNVKIIKLAAFSYICLSLLGCRLIKSKPENIMSPGMDLYQYIASNPEAKIRSIDGKDADLSQYKGRKVLIVNVASECGYTPQYEDLQKLQDAYAGKLVILGFPSNDFGGQEPGSNEEIQEFCKKNYGVSFPLFEKISVTGSSQHPVYRWLTTKELNGWNEHQPKWNFNKYLLDESGNLLKYYSSTVKPFDNEIISHLK